MSWIKIIPYTASTGTLRRIYDRVKGPDDYIDNILQVHSLRPHTLQGHMTLYKNVLHHTGNTLPKWLLETLGVYVSLLNGCAYCVEHHFEGLRGLLQDEARTSAIREALETSTFDGVFDEREQAVLRYAGHLTRVPTEVDLAHIAAMREAGLDDGEILEVNQVVSYFAYANRTVLGLGVSTEGDILGLSPGDSDHPDNWHHR
ncbi:MAG: carboxymuconolactone decarboxylase family protein [Rhodothermales bacterium]